MTANQGFGQLGPNDYASDHNSVVFVIMQNLARFRSVVLVRVQSCSNEGLLSSWGTVTAVPVINMTDGVGNTQNHGIIYNLPYIRIQGGADAIIMDPKIGDFGVALICDRDISSAKANQGEPTQANFYNPSTARMGNLADGIYLGGCLNGIPTRFIQFDAIGNINLIAPGAVNIVAPGGLTVNGIPVTVP